MTPEQFVEKWRNTQLTEKAASQEHFIDLCHMIGEPTPAEADPTGQDYCFEKAVQVIGVASKGSKGTGGFVDVWKRGCFAWEYKRQDQYKDLNDAYRQVYQYRDALDNPPLTVVCDISALEIRTHFSGFPTERRVIRLGEMPGQLDTLRRLFKHPETFRPFKTRANVTTEAANEFGKLADSLIERFTTGRSDPEAHKVAHFLMKLMFCLFVEDIDLLPGKTFTRLINRSLIDPESFPKRAGELFQKMREGGDYGNEVIPWFNGGLFDEAPPMALKHGDIMALQRIAQLDWGGVEPSIFGTLFERILDPDKRAQIGAHYTSKDDILLVIEPVIMMPLRRKWTKLQEELRDELLGYASLPLKKRLPAADALGAKFEVLRSELGTLKVLDPACGSGNFLYVALQQLLDLDAEIVTFASRHGVGLPPLPHIRPTQMHGIEINPYAAELAQVVIWIGYLQWLKERGLDVPNKPILDKLECIENRDAILDLSDPKNPAPAKWPEADFIIGNPPFLGASLLRRNLGDGYVGALFRTYEIPNSSDLCCYWFARAWRKVSTGQTQRAGLLATQGIRGPQSRAVLRNVVEFGGIFDAWSDRNWILDGAMVHVSIICFDRGAEMPRRLDGIQVAEITPQLTSHIDTGKAKPLPENASTGFFGDTKKGEFDITWQEARRLLSDRGNPVPRNNDDVLRPWVNGLDLNSRCRGMWIIDFPSSSSEAEASQYCAPYAVVRERVKPARDCVRSAAERRNWWIHARAAEDFREAARPLRRYIGTCRVSRHRLFSFIDGRILPDGQVIVFTRQDDYFLGALQCSVHEVWSREMATQLREEESGLRYRVSSCFETFPLPWPPGKDDIHHPAYLRISEAAKELDEMRERWLNPPEWIELIAKKIDDTDDFSDVPAEARPLIRQSAIMDLAAKDARLKKRTLTNLYNERPTWLKLAHEKLDRAVLAAYNATDPAGHWCENMAEVFVETGAGQPLPANHALTARRAEVEKTILENLLRLNLERANGTGPGIESAAMDRIRKTPGVCGGKARIRDTRIPVWTVIQLQRHGRAPDELLRDYPSLEPADIEAATQYYRKHRDEIDSHIKDEEQDD